MPRRLRIHHQLLVVSVLILLPLVANTLVSARREWVQRRDVIFASHREMAEAVGQVLEGFFQNFADTQEAMAIAARTGISSREAFHTFIREVAAANQYLLGYAVIAADGPLANSDPSPAWWQSLRDRSDVAAVRSGRRWAVSNLQHAADGAPVVTVTTSLSGSGGLLLRSVIDVRALDGPLHLHLRPGWRVMIVDAQGRLIYHTLDPDRKWDERDWRRDTGVQEALAHGESRREGYRSHVDGQSCLASYTLQRATGWVVGSSCPMELAMAPVHAALVADYQQITAALAGSLALICVFWRRISRPIEQLAAAATAFGRGERPSFVPEDRQDEVGVLARALETMASQVQERLDRERTIARTLQEAFLPQRLPELPGYTMAAVYHPAVQEAQVGGDFYDVFRLPGGGIGILIGDVSLKGVAGSIYATMARYMTRAYAFQTNAPAEVLKRLNRALFDAIQDNCVFVTAFYAILTPESRTLSYANAGHWPPLLARRQQTEVVGGHGVGLGISPDASYEQGHIRLGPGDTFLLFTDGLVEAGGGDPMGHLEAVQKMLGGRHDEPPRQLVERLYREALRRGGRAAHDDVALLALRCDEPSLRCDPEGHGRVSSRSSGRQRVGDSLNVSEADG
jgi:serine phosphatase RsbU (regulator of sigma subunit)